uniref:DUF5641 domain-containing protein n=1 Tax=Megaselia scalaris TaxID=36166 RepID=T1GCJ4_MEGSC
MEKLMCNDGLIFKPKGQRNEIDIQIGQLVLIIDEDLSPTTWPTAIVTELFPGKDNVTRVATVRTSSGKTYKRPVVKLRILPCNTPLEN